MNSPAAKKSKPAEPTTESIQPINLSITTTEQSPTAIDIKSKKNPPATKKSIQHTESPNDASTKEATQPTNFSDDKLSMKTPNSIYIGPISQSTTPEMVKLYVLQKTLYDTDVKRYKINDRYVFHIRFKDYKQFNSGYQLLKNTNKFLGTDKYTIFIRQSSIYSS